MRPFLVTDLQAGKLPRWALLLLCALYVIPGLLGRDPWRVEDATGFGIAASFTQLPLSHWLVPQVYGLPVPQSGWMPFWLWAAVGKLTPEAVGSALVVRVMAGLQLIALFFAFWQAVYWVAKRPGLQPIDPLGASATRIDFARTIADSSLLLLLATLGLLARMHETTGYATQVLWVVLALFGAAMALESPRRGGVIAAVAVVLSLLTTGVATALAVGMALVMLPVLSQPYRLVQQAWLLSLLTGIGIALIGCAALVSFSGHESQAFVHLWWDHQLSVWNGLNPRPLAYALRTLPWFLWPSWPIALWALIRWRTRLEEPIFALPLVVGAGLSVPALFSGQGSENVWLVVIPCVAMLGAIGLPTLSRKVISLIDWLAVVSFSLFGLIAWAYWIALMTGTPPRMAFKASQIAPGFVPELSVIELVLSIVATLAWLWLVRWRVSRQPPMIWRAVALASGGLVLAWFLLMTLWLPVFNERNTYRDVAVQLGSKVPQGCIVARSLGLAERASLGYFGKLRFAEQAADPSTCEWLLIQDYGPIAQLVRPEETGWRWVLEVRRRTSNQERFRLYKR
jgi:hypothetical protein